MDKGKPVAFCQTCGRFTNQLVDGICNRCWIKSIGESKKVLVKMLSGKDEFEKKNCIGYEQCKKYSDGEDLHCDDCDHFFDLSVIDDLIERDYWHRMSISK